METIKKIIDWLLSITPTWLRATIIALVAVLIFLFSLASCSSTRAVVRTKDNGTATVTITTENPVSVQASPNVELEINPKNHESAL